MKTKRNRELRFEQCESRIVLTSGCQAFGATIVELAHTGELGQAAKQVATSAPGAISEVVHDWQDDICGEH